MNKLNRKIDNKASAGQSVWLYLATQMLTSRTKNAKIKNSMAIVNRRPMYSMINIVMNRPENNPQQTITTLQQCRLHTDGYISLYQNCGSIFDRISELV